MEFKKNVRNRKRKDSAEISDTTEDFFNNNEKKLNCLLSDSKQKDDKKPAVNTKTNDSSKCSATYQNPFNSLKINIEIDLTFIILLVMSLCTRFYNLEEPKHIVFDELHYGRYVSLYTKGIFFFDTHPPLGKQLLYLAGQFGGYDGNFTFDRIGSPYSDKVPIKALRFVPALAGSLLVPLAYKLMLALSVSQPVAVLASLLILFENSFLVQSRFMLLECIQMCFGLLGMVCAVHGARSGGVRALGWLLGSALAAGACFSVKYSGIYTLWCTMLVWRYRRGWGRPLLLALLAAAVYGAALSLHLLALPRAGPHDSVMTSAFQACLEGGLASITRGQPTHVAHGSQITLRHSHGRACWLHSHAHVYPVRLADGRGSSHQQQVTCYSFKDVNNWWIVKLPDRDSLAVDVPPRVIRHGDVVQLLHGISSRALNSHDVAAPASPHSQEVSCYIDYNVSMPAQNLWRVDIVNRVNDDDAWEGIKSLVRLIHIPTGAALRYSGRQLPAWGFHQHEVVADKVLTHQDTVWNVEEHRYTKAEERRERERELVSAEMIPTTTTKLSFWARLWELQYKMATHASDAPLGHMFASEPIDWPLLARSIAYWLSPNSNAQVHLIGNLLTWYTATAAVFIYAFLLVVYALRQRRAIYDLSDQQFANFYQAGVVLFVGYWLHYLPYFFVDRTLFLHHYLPAYLFKILVLAYVIDHIYCIIQRHEKLRPLANLYILSVAVWFAYVVITFHKFSVLNYGTTDLTENDLMNLRWKDTWDFILHKKS